MTEGYSEYDHAGVPQDIFTGRSPELAPSVCSDDVADDEGLDMYGDLHKMEPSSPFKSLTVRSAPSTQPVVVVVGPEQKEYELDEPVVTQIPCFKNTFRWGVFRESTERILRLPEDEPTVFERVLEFLGTGDYFPRLVPAVAKCEQEYNRKLFQQHHDLVEYLGYTSCPEKHHWFSGNAPDECCDLEVPLEVIQRSQPNNTCAFKHTDPPLGQWQTTEATHKLLEDEVLLFCMAEKFLLEDLKDLSYRKILLFPKGPRELALLADHIPARVYRESSFRDATTTSFRIHELLSSCIRYHQRFFDKWRSSDRLDQTSPDADLYIDYMDIIEREMTPHGATLFHEIARARDANEEEPARWLYRWWSCAEEPIAILQKHYAEVDAKLDWLSYAVPRDQDAITKVPDVLEGDNLFKGFDFCASRCGDTISRITVDKPIKGLAYGYNIRCEQWGFFPRRHLRFLQAKSWKDCSCIDCAAPTARPRGGTSFFMHDPLGLGKPYRNPSRQKQIMEGLRRRRCSTFPVEEDEQTAAKDES